MSDKRRLGDNLASSAAKPNEYTESVANTTERPSDLASSAAKPAACVEVSLHGPTPDNEVSAFSSTSTDKGNGKGDFVNEDETRQVDTGRLADRLPQTRYIASIYSLGPSQVYGDVHSVMCIMLYKGSLGDDALREFIERHITTAVVPQMTLGDGECMSTMNLVRRTLEDSPPALCGQLLDFCSRPNAVPFLDPLSDGAGHQVTLLSWESGHWDHARVVVERLADAMSWDAVLASDRLARAEH